MAETKRILIIGQGSIGKKHANILHNMGADIYVVTQHDSQYTAFSSIEEALFNITADICIIASPTYRHMADYATLQHHHFHGIIVIEKPLSKHYDECHYMNHDNIVIAYNLRFHPLIQYMAHYVENSIIYGAHIYVGQYLPTWRSNGHYSQSYSADKDKGGGVLRDLSHELDYSVWLLGKLHAVSAVGGKKSNLNITSDDIWHIIGTIGPHRAALSISLNYLDSNLRRTVRIYSNKGTIEADLVNNMIMVDGVQVKTDIVIDDASYIYMHQALLCNHLHQFCTVKEAKNIMNIINVIEQAADSKTWITYNNDK